MDKYQVKFTDRQDARIVFILAYDRVNAIETIDGQYPDARITHMFNITRGRVEFDLQGKDK